MAGKRSYTVPIMLIILTVMATMLVMAYSKLLLSQQDHAIKDGKRLSEQYNYALIFADRLHVTAEALLQEHAATARIQAASLLGEAKGVKNEALDLLTEASSRSKIPSRDETFKQLQAAMSTLFPDSGSVFNPLFDQAEPLSADQVLLLQVVRDGASGMKAALDEFRPPTMDSGYRIMATGADWVEPALAASQAFVEMTSKLARAE